jgi:hypothetical protein
MEKSIKELKEDYKNFIENINENLMKMKILLNKNELTFDKTEINESVIFYHKNYKNPIKLNLTENEFENIIDAYWGEAFIKYKGGEWALNLSKKDEAFGTPTIEKWGGKDYPWSRIGLNVWRSRVKKWGLDDMLPATYIYGVE